MTITELQVSLTAFSTQHRDGVLAFVRLVLDGDLAIRDIKVMERDGAIYLGMPSRKTVEPCNRCKRKVALVDIYCSYCGAHLPGRPVGRDVKQHVDVVHPINQEFRRFLEEAIVVQYNKMVPEDRQLTRKDD